MVYRPLNMAPLGSDVGGVAGDGAGRPPSGTIPAGGTDGAGEPAGGAAKPKPRPGASLN